MAFNPDSTVYIERGNAFLGSVALDLDSLTFEPEGTTGTRLLDRNNVDRIAKLLKRFGCDRYDPDSHVPALINKQTLVTCLGSVNLTIEQLKSGGLTKLPGLAISKVLCLHGKHRISAAQQHLRFDDRWWSAACTMMVSDDLHNLL